MTLRVAIGSNPGRIFERPSQVWAPLSFDEALQALRDAQEALDAGYWLAGGFTYEFGASLAGVRGRKSPHPLFVIGAFGQPREAIATQKPGPAALTAPMSIVQFDEYARNIEYIRERIRDGDVYQVNYTVPFDLRFEGNLSSLYYALASASHARYTVLLEYEGLAVVSLSPELFLKFDGKRIVTKPMKGTALPGDDATLANEKNRSEHLMIVDLLRNDLHRICTGVRVERLFEVERYPTFATMTSTIAGNLRDGVGLDALLRATFPCGSVTGAPKIAAMQQIAAVESFPRGFYTGSLGYLSPARRGWWNVAIRTLQVERDRARFDAGGGIVSDSQAGDEWREIAVKSAFLGAATKRFKLIERFRGGNTPSDVTAHRNRLTRSAALFGYRIDEAALDEAFARFRQLSDPLLVRITLDSCGPLAVAQALESVVQPVRLFLSQLRIDSADAFLHHKTSWRPVHEHALTEAASHGCFDAILCNERGEVTEGARTNIFVQMGNMLHTPPLGSGVLPGVLRARLLTEGRAVERVIFPKDLDSAQAIFAGNSARGLLRAEIIR